jgi:hypothetical protein
MRARLLSVVLLLVATACASSGGAAGGGGNANLLTAQDIQTNAISQGEPLYSTIERIRPQWLAVRAGQPEPAVFIDGANAGTLGALRTVNAGNVQEVRYIRAEAAAARFGGGFEGGVIEVVLRQ